MVQLSISDFQMIGYCSEVQLSDHCLVTKLDHFIDKERKFSLYIYKMLSGYLTAGFISDVRLANGVRLSDSGLS
jgi:hypothetical protein